MLVLTWKMESGSKCHNDHAGQVRKLVRGSKCQRKSVRPQGRDGIPRAELEEVDEGRTRNIRQKSARRLWKESLDCLLRPCTLSQAEIEMW